MHEDSGEQKEDSLSLSLSLFSFTHLAFLSSLYVLVYTHVHTYTPVESVHIYIYTHAYRRSVVVCCSKREKWFAEGGGMKREGEEGEELKLPGKERNRVGLNLLDCFQLHASSYSLSLFIPFFLYSPSSSLVDTLRPSPLSFLLPHCGEKTFDGAGRAESIRVDPIHRALLGLIGHFLLSICD